MTVHDFANMVIRMLDTQQEYFKSAGKPNDVRKPILLESKKLEREVKDAALAVLRGPDAQGDFWK